MTGLTLALTARKEVRALFFTWIAIVIALAGSGARRIGVPLECAVRFFHGECFSLEPIGLVVYALGAIALGTQVFGQEFGNRTLGLLLSQPVSRRFVLVVKMSVLAAMLVALVVIAVAVRPGASMMSSSGQLEFRIVILIALCGLFVAPCLTLLTRSGLAGFVFSIAALGGIAVACEVMGIAILGSAAPEQTNAFRQVGVMAGMLVASLAGAIGTWWTFMRIEVAEGERGTVHMTGWLRRPTDRSAPALRPAPRYPIAQLVRKELHLQQLASVVAALFILSCVGLLLLRFLVPASRPELVEIVTILYMAMLAVVVGSVSSAEERSFGTLQWQLLLPVSARTQWMVKAGVALGIVIGLGVGLPGLLLWVSGRLTWWLGVWQYATLMLVLLTSLSLYVSSLSSTGVRALLTAIATAIGAALAVGPLERSIYLAVDWWTRRDGFIMFGYGVMAQPWTRRVAVGVVSALLLHFASVNHRAAQGAVAPLRWQIGWLVSVIILIMVTVLLVTTEWIPWPPVPRGL